MSESNKRKPINTYVSHEDVDFFVSTVWYQSYANHWHAETVGWKCTDDDNPRGNFVALEVDGPALDQHMGMVKQFLETGGYRNA